MKIIKTDFEGLVVIQPDVYADNRGYFFEAYNREKYFLKNTASYFVQDNISKSKYGTIRGLHYQIEPYAQGKLCQVITGRVLDVTVDIRSGSPTYGKYFEIELSEENHTQLWIPPGFAHGFSVLSEEAVFLYKCTNYYNKQHERAIIYNDPELGIDWRVNDPLVSEKDLEAGLFKDIALDFKL